MLGKKPKNMTTEEIRAAADKIRKKYDDYIIQYMKAPEIKKGFEDRYLYALRNRLDMARFFMAEKQALDQLCEEEEKELRKSWNKEEQKRKTSGKSIADRVIEEQENRIMEHYPMVEIHKEASGEICYLFGALQVFEQKYWPNIQNMLRKYFKQFYTGSRASLESAVLDLCCANLDGLPPRLMGYAHLFERFPRDYSRIEKEEKMYLTETSVLLNRVSEEIKKIFAEQELTEEERGLISSANIYVNDLMMDFRLKDLAKLHKGVDHGFRDNK